MKRLLQLGFVIGFAAAAAAAYFLPWISYQRYPSATTAVMNGGRGERFVIRLPNDRIDAATNLASAVGPLHQPYAPEAGLDGVAATASEHFKLRDIDGNVIGIATRHLTSDAEGTSTAWLLTLPARGSIAFGGRTGPMDRIESALASAGFTPGQPFAGEFSVPTAAGMSSVHSSREFDGIAFNLDVTWFVTGVDDEGQLRGTIELATVGRSQ